MEKQEMAQLVELALADLVRAIDALFAPRTPRVPPPSRPKYFTWEGGFTWPSPFHKGKDAYYRVICPGGTAAARYEYALDNSYYRPGNARDMVERLGVYPHRVWRLVQDIRRSEAWVRARCEGLDRHAAEIQKQQQKYIEKLEDEIAMAILEGKLKGGKQ